ncbi:MAG: DUF3302 domain-containing protein [Gammaproteobacteria bacterium]|nr:DUF3302 domain-containing protein [Gammaproteobacteria bacterium]
MKLEIIALGLIFFSVIVITLGIIKIHTYPGKIAKDRNHPQTEAIEVTALLGLLIFPLWMAALVWAYSGAVIGKLYTAGMEEGEKTENEIKDRPSMNSQEPSLPDSEVVEDASDAIEER